MISLRKILRKIKRKFHLNATDRILRSGSGVIHVGANIGQEREQYYKMDLNVLWVEPIPHIFEQLNENISDIPKQEAIQALVTDKDGESYDFNIASNNGASSSIFDIKEHADIWPDVKFEDRIGLNSITLASLLQKYSIDLSFYDTLIMDTQGSELLVLKGAGSILRKFSFVRTEVADFESYSGCCQLDDINEFMELNKFRQFSRYAFAHRKDGGTYFDIIYKREAW